MSEVKGKETRNLDIEDDDNLIYASYKFIIGYIFKDGALSGAVIMYSDPKNLTPRFFRAVLTDGVLHVPQPGSEEVRA